MSRGKNKIKLFNKTAAEMKFGFLFTDVSHKTQSIKSLVTNLTYGYAHCTRPPVKLSRAGNWASWLSADDVRAVAVNFVLLLQNSRCIVNRT